MQCELDAVPGRHHEVHTARPARGCSAQGNSHCSCSVWDCHHSFTASRHQDRHSCPWPSLNVDMHAGQHSTCNTLCIFFCGSVVFPTQIRTAAEDTPSPRCMEDTQAGLESSKRVCASKASVSSDCGLRLLIKCRCCRWCLPHSQTAALLTLF